VRCICRAAFSNGWKKPLLFFRGLENVGEEAVATAVRSYDFIFFRPAEICFYAKDVLRQLLVIIIFDFSAPRCVGKADCDESFLRAVFVDFIGVFDRFSGAGEFFLQNKLRGFFLCVLSPALFETKRAAKRVRIEREIVLQKIILKNGLPNKLRCV